MALESTSARCHALAPPAGAVELTTPPASSSATHNDADGQDTASKFVVPSIAVVVQVPVGSPAVKALPRVSTPTQEFERQATFRAARSESTAWTVQSDAWALVGLSLPATCPSALTAVHAVAEHEIPVHVPPSVARSPTVTEVQALE
jgi:hypothetical protein